MFFMDSSVMFVIASVYWIKIRQKLGTRLVVGMHPRFRPGFLSSGLTVALENLVHQVQYHSVLRCHIEAALQAAGTKRRHRL